MNGIVSGKVALAWAAKVFGIVSPRPWKGRIHGHSLADRGSDLSSGLTRSVPTTSRGQTKGRSCKSETLAIRQACGRHTNQQTDAALDGTTGQAKMMQQSSFYTDEILQLQ